MRLSFKFKNLAFVANMVQYWVTRNLRTNSIDSGKQILQSELYTITLQEYFYVTENVQQEIKKLLSMLVNVSLYYSTCGYLRNISDVSKLSNIEKLRLDKFICLANSWHSFVIVWGNYLDQKNYVTLCSSNTRDYLNLSLQINNVKIEKIADSILIHIFLQFY